MNLRALSTQILSEYCIVQITAVKTKLGQVHRFLNFTVTEINELERSLNYIYTGSHFKLLIHSPIYHLNPH